MEYQTVFYSKFAFYLLTDLTVSWFMRSDYWLKKMRKHHHPNSVGLCIRASSMVIDRQRFQVRVIEASRAFWSLQHGDVRLEPKVSQIGPQLDKSGTFSDHISVHFGSTKSNLKKSRICPIWGQSDPLRSQIWIPESVSLLHPKLFIYSADLVAIVYDRADSLCPVWL